MSVATHEARFTSLEVRVTGLEERATAVDEMLYRLTRNSIKNDLRIEMMLKAMGLPDVAEDRIDEILDEG